MFFCLLITVCRVTCRTFPPVCVQGGKKLWSDPLVVMVVVFLSLILLKWLIELWHLHFHVSTHTHTHTFPCRSSYSRPHLNNVSTVRQCFPLKPTLQTGEVEPGKQGRSTVKTNPRVGHKHENKKAALNTFAVNMKIDTWFVSYYFVDRIISCTDTFVLKLNSGDSVADTSESVYPVLWNPPNGYLLFHLIHLVLVNVA